MSIIYDALKKVEESNNISSREKVSKEHKLKPKIYLVYILVICLGFFIASIFLELFTKPLQINTKVISKNLPQIDKTPDLNIIPQTLPPKDTPISESNISYQPPETKKEPEVSFVLNGVFFSQDEGYALINNRIVKEGDLVDGMTVKRIRLEEVELRNPEGLTIKLSPGK